MVGPMYDFLQNPLGALRLTFQNFIASGFDPATESDWGAARPFRDFLSHQNNLSQVPVLGADTIGRLQPNTLVRFRGVVQEMLGNEYYAGAYQYGDGWRTYKYMDLSEVPMQDYTLMRYWGRLMYHCVPVPGLNSWAHLSGEDGSVRSMVSGSQERIKRRRMDVEVECNNDVTIAEKMVEDSPSTKTKRDDGHTSTSSNIGDLRMSTTVLRNAERNGFSCLVKTYDTPEYELNLNDVFEFVGILSFDPEFANRSEDSFNSFYDNVSVDFPPNKVPRLHCMVHRKLAISDFIRPSPAMETKFQIFKYARETLLQHLTAILGNDGVAANFMLLHLLSKVHERFENVTVGKLSLNLTSLTRENMSIFGTRLTNAIKNLLPLTYFVPLTMGYLNRASFGPKKHYLMNRQLAGDLRLPEGSHFIIDETRLQAGTLNSVGVENVRFLKDVVTSQKVYYDFTYYYKEVVTTDVQLLILSEEKSNLLPADVVLPFQPSSVCSTEVSSAELLDAWRWYLATARSLPHTTEQEIQKVVEDDLVAAWQADHSLGNEDFSRLLTMGRLVSASFGETTLSLEHWQIVKDLERLRRQRM